MQLERWIAAAHLDPANQAAAADRYSSDPLHSIWFDDFLCPEVLAGLRRVFCEEGSFAQNISVRDRSLPSGRRETTLAEFLAAPAADRFENELILQGPRPEYRLGPGFLTYVRFGFMLRSAAFRDFLSAVTRQDPGTVRGTQTRIMGTEQFVGRHDDGGDGRALCMVLYLSPSWLPADRGILRQFGPGGAMREVEPRPNRAIIFRVGPGLSHEVDAVAAGGAPRWSVTIWFGFEPVGLPPAAADGER